MTSARRSRRTRPRLPDGTVTFVFTDIEGSTRLWETRREAMGRALARHDVLRLHAMHANSAGLYFCHTGELQRARDLLAAYLSLSRQMHSDSDELTALSLLADLDVATGQADRAVEALRDPLSRLRASATRHYDGLLFRNYATALMESGRLEEAESAFREALPLTRRAYGSAAFVLHDAALLLALRGHIADAAKVSAYAEGVYASMRRKPRPVAQSSGERLRRLLSVQPGAEALTRLSDEGRLLTEDQACMLALPPLTKSA